MSFQVVSADAEQESLSDSIRLVGTLVANEEIDVTSEIAGIVDEIHFREGERVVKGELLVKLNTDKLDAQIKETEATYELARTNYERGKSLRQQNVISDEELDERENRYRTAEAILSLRGSQREDAVIRAPFDGIVAERRVSPGQYLNPGQPITRLVDITPIKAEFKVPERFFSQLSIGRNVGLAVTAYPDETFHGTVYFIAPELDLLTRTVLVKAELPNQDLRLKPGMFGNLNLTLNVKEHAVLIPESAVFFQGDQKFVYVIQDDGTAAIRPVETGIRVPGRVELTRGVGPGERVVSEGHQKLFPGAPVRVSGDESLSGAG